MRLSLDETIAGRTSETPGDEAVIIIDLPDGIKLPVYIDEIEDPTNPLRSTIYLSKTGRGKARWHHPTKGFVDDDPRLSNIRDIDNYV